MSTVRVKSQTRVFKRVEVDAARAKIQGDADRDFVSLHISGMQFKEQGGGHGYFYDNWAPHELKDLADGIYKFLSLHQKGAELLAASVAEGTVP